MKKKNALLLLILFTITIAISSCATKKKYGCPERIVSAFTTQLA